MNTKLKDIITTVNTELPGWCRGMLQPSDMARTGDAICFGRIATIGAALRTSGVPDEALTLLISRSHALEFKPGRCWLGHVALVVDVEDGILVDPPIYAAHTRDLRATTWPGTLASDDQIEVLDKDKVAKYTRYEWDSEPYFSYVYGTWDIALIYCPSACPRH